MRLKTDNPAVEPADDTETHTIETIPGKILYIDAECAYCVGESLSDLMNLGSVFAEHVSVVVGIDGLEAIIIPRSIFDTIELADEPENYIEGMLMHLKANEEADSIHIIVNHLDQRERNALSKLVKTYFQSKSNDFKPPMSAFSDASPEIKDLISKILKNNQGK